MAAQRDPVEPLARLNSAPEDGSDWQGEDHFADTKMQVGNSSCGFPYRRTRSLGSERGRGLGKELQDVRFERTRLGLLSIPAIQPGELRGGTNPRLTPLAIITATPSCCGLPTEDDGPLPSRQ